MSKVNLHHKVIPGPIYIIPKLGTPKVIEVNSGEIHQPNDAGKLWLLYRLKKDGFCEYASDAEWTLDRAKAYLKVLARIMVRRPSLQRQLADLAKLEAKYAHPPMPFTGDE